jgi:hypothetical protein
MLKILFTILSFSYSIIVFCQETNLAETITNIAEELAADDSDPEGAVAYVERLNELAENPVKLNSAGENELSRLFFLTDFQIKALTDYIHSSGRIISVYELSNIPGFDRETTEMMIPFVSLENKTITDSDSIRWKSTSLTNLSVRSGGEEVKQTGSSWKILTKYKFNSGSFSGGITVEKDPGETFLSGDPPLPDFVSEHITYNGDGLIKRIILGDYSARFGQGTNINTGMQTAVSPASTGYMSVRNEIKPYTSTDENNFFRGLAVELALRNFALSLFYSNNCQDATLVASSDTSESYIAGFYTAGIHDTPSTQRKKDAISEQLLGLNLSFNLKTIRMGFTWSGERFSLPVKPEINNPADIFKFEGSSNSLYTFYYNCFIKRILVYGELTSNEFLKYAFVQGLSFRPSDRLTINLLTRNYNNGYTSFHGMGPGYRSATGNGKAILGNFTFEAAKHLFISGGCDFQDFKWLKYRCSSPSSAIRKELILKYIPADKLTIDASYNYRSAITDKPETTGIPDQLKTITKGIKVAVHYSFSENLTLATRIEYKRSYPTGSTGTLLLQDLNYRFRQLPASVWLRYCLFRTDSWDSRLYTYENDLLYSFSIPALSGEGSRSYIMVKWDIGEIAEIRLKYALTSPAENSTALLIRNELKIQFRVWF